MRKIQSTDLTVILQLGNRQQIGTITERLDAITQQCKRQHVRLPANTTYLQLHSQTVLHNSFTGRSFDLSKVNECRSSDIIELDGGFIPQIPMHIICSLRCQVNCTIHILTIALQINDDDLIDKVESNVSTTVLLTAGFQDNLDNQVPE